MARRTDVRLSSRLLAELLCVLVCTLLFLFTAFAAATVVLGGQPAGTRDYIEYWASGQQLVHHQNPYDPPAIQRLERAEGLPSNIPPMVMGNAPPALLLTWPLGFLSVKTGELLWMLMLLGTFVGAVKLISDAVAPGSTIVKTLGYSFGPAIACIPIGQMALLVLLGLAVFLRFYKTRPAAAGAALWLCLLKPQVFIPFGLVMCAWLWTTKNFRVLVGAATAVGLSVALISAVDRHCWSEYRAMMQLMRYDRVVIPCWSVVLREGIPGIPFLQYLPAAVGSVWAMAYFRKNRAHWDWMEHGASVMLVSLLVAPYTWFIDQCIALPALLRGAAITQSRTMLMALGLTTAVMEFGLLTKLDLLHSKFYLWTAPFYLIWYFVAVRKASNATKCPQIAASQPPHFQTEAGA